MTYDEWKNRLNHYRELINQLRYKENQLKFFDERIQGCGGIDTSTPRVDGGNPISMSQLIAKKLDYEKGYLELVDTANSYAETIYNDINKYLDNELYKQVLIMFYIELLDVNNIATTLKYSIKHIYKCKNNAIKELADATEGLQIGEEKHEIYIDNTRN